MGHLTYSRTGKRSTAYQINENWISVETSLLIVTPSHIHFSLISHQFHSLQSASFVHIRLKIPHLSSSNQSQVKEASCAYPPLLIITIDSPHSLSLEPDQPVKPTIVQNTISKHTISTLFHNTARISLPSRPASDLTCCSTNASPLFSSA